MTDFLKSQKDFLNIFSFVKDEKTKKYCISHLAYCSCLVDECKELYPTDKDLLEYKTHTINLYIGSIVESICHYFIGEIFKKNPKKLEKYLQNTEMKVENITELKGEKYFICTKKEKDITFSDSLNFNQVIHGIRSSKLIKDSIIKKIDEIRNMRNTIHIVLYEKDLVSFDDIDENLKFTLEIIEEIKKVLQ